MPVTIIWVGITIRTRIVNSNTVKIKISKTEALRAAIIIRDTGIMITTTPTSGAAGGTSVVAITSKPILTTNGATRDFGEIITRKKITRTATTKTGRGNAVGMVTIRTTTKAAVTN